MNKILTAVVVLVLVFISGCASITTERTDKNGNKTVTKELKWVPLPVIIDRPYYYNRGYNEYRPMPYCWKEYYNGRPVRVCS